MSDNQLTAGWKAAVVASLTLGLLSVGLSLARTPPTATSAAYEGKIASLEGRIKAVQQQSARPGAKPSDMGIGE